MGRGVRGGGGGHDLLERRGQGEVLLAPRWAKQPRQTEQHQKQERATGQTAQPKGRKGPWRQLAKEDAAPEGQAHAGRRDGAERTAGRRPASLLRLEPGEGVQRAVPEQTRTRVRTLPRGRTPEGGLRRASQVKACPWQEAGAEKQDADNRGRQEAARERKHVTPRTSLGLAGEKRQGAAKQGAERQGSQAQGGAPRTSRTPRGRT